MFFLYGLGQTWAEPLAFIPGLEILTFADTLGRKKSRLSLEKKEIWLKSGEKKLSPGTERVKARPRLESVMIRLRSRELKLSRAQSMQSSMIYYWIIIISGYCQLFGIPAAWARYSLFAG